MDWLQIAKELGPNGVLLMFFIYAARWVAIHVAKPLVTGHTSFLQATTLHMSKVETWLESHAKSLENLAETSALQSKMLEKLADQKPQRPRR